MRFSWNDFAYFPVKNNFSQTLHIPVAKKVLNLPQGVIIISLSTIALFCMKLQINRIDLFDNFIWILWNIFHHNFNTSRKFFDNFSIVVEFY